MNDEIFSVFAALNDLNERVKRLEKQIPDYNADMIEVGRTIGAVNAKIVGIEKTLKTLDERRNEHE